ncbi:peroxisomal N(1)-acetyl-spermine/spermidine oxidase-like [Hypanus sabinus]|uniref:peroxisomal N(1)-acetyl-spermine/spermidine oxidase-like n=1 Tax=Hypanus sabinus TaxID=79690 RepID=UPI0028C4299C|nr:peroxisomal N(1)-acetyl-spermine/spermidine oxidase-like [Hypanus sabinus]
MATADGDLGPGRDCNIVIVGCGIAGIAAAQRLMEHGFGRVRIIEATERCGGRIWSHSFGENGAVMDRAAAKQHASLARSRATAANEHRAVKGLVEIGAQWIHGPSKRNAVFQLAGQYGLLDETAMSEENQAVQLDTHLPAMTTWYTSSGKRIDPEIAASMEDLYSTLCLKSREFFQSKKEPVQSLGEFLKCEIAQCAESWKDNEELCSLKLALLNVEFKLECCVAGTDSLDLLALQPYGEYVMLPGIDCTFPRGFNSLIDEMMKPLPKNLVSFNKSVKCIHWNGSFETPAALKQSYPVVVECEDGKSIPADHVIVTVPLGNVPFEIHFPNKLHRLATHRFDPGLNTGFLKEHYKAFFYPPFLPSKTNSIQKMGFGTIDKIFLEFDEPFWEPEYDLIKLVWEDESPLNDRPPDLQKTWFRKVLGFIVLKPAERYGHVLLAVLTGQEANLMEQLSDSDVKDCLTQIIHQFTGNPSIPPPKSIVQGSTTFTTGRAIWTHFPQKRKHWEPQRMRLRSHGLPTPGIVRSKWYSDRFTKGSYSYVEVGSSGDDIDVIAQPLPSTSAEEQAFTADRTKHNRINEELHTT